MMGYELLTGVVGAVMSFSVSQGAVPLQLLPAHDLRAPAAKPHVARATSGDPRPLRQPVVALRRSPPPGRLLLEHDDGNNAFRQQDYKKAVKLYSQAISLCDGPAAGGSRYRTS